MLERSITMLVLCGVAAIVNGGVALWAFRHRRGVSAARAFAVLNLLQMLWHVAHFAETWSATLDAKLWWDSLQNIPAAAMGVTTLWVVLDDLHMQLPRRTWSFMLAVVAAVGLPLATEPLHHQLRTQAELIGHPPVLVYPFGILDLCNFTFAYAAILVAVALELRAVAQTHRAYVPQRMAIALALAAPVLTTTVGMTLQMRIDGDRDLSPVTTLFGALLAVWGLARHRLFDLTPIARETVIANLPEGVIAIDEQGRITDINLAALALTSHKQAIGESYRTVFAAWPALVRVIEAGRNDTQDIGHAPAAPNLFYEATCTALVDERGKAFGYALVLRDITQHRDRYEQTRQSLARETAERHWVESELAVSEERFRALFDQVFQLTGLLDREGRVVACNRAALRMIDAEESELVGKYFWQTPWWSHSEQAAALIKHGIERCAQGEFVRFQTMHVDAAGAPRHIDFSLTPVRDVHDRVVQMIPEGRDVTALYEERDRANQLADQLQRAQRLDSMGRLAGGLAHDFNNLLTVIRCSADLLSDDVPEGSDGREYLVSIKDAVDTAGEITRGLLAFGRQQPMQTQHVKINQVVRATEKLVRRLIRENIEIEVHTSDQLWEVRADATQLQQVVMNLVLNAQDAMPDGGKLQVRAQNVALDAAEAAKIAGGRAGEFLCLTVIDDGIGMPADVQARAFEPFFSTKEHGKGTGLGLAIVHGAVTQCGGFIDLRSAPGLGTTFDLYFPRAVSVSPSPVPLTHVALGARRRARICVVEDQAPVRRTVQRVLEAEGHQVLTFGSAAELLNTTLDPSEEPELLVTDIVMPVMNGFELAGALSARLPHLRVLIMSGYAETPELERVAKLPADAFLPKPFAPAALVEKVRAALDRLPPWAEITRKTWPPRPDHDARK